MRAHKRTIDCCDTACVLSCVHSHSHIHSLPAKSLLLGNLSNFMSVQLTLPSRRDPSSSHSPAIPIPIPIPAFFTSIPRRRRLAACTCSAGHLLDSRRAFICFYICPRFQLNAMALGSTWIRRLGSEIPWRAFIPCQETGCSKWVH